MKFGLARKDLHVTLDGVDIKAALALGSWVAFKKDGGSSMVMGDLVLTQDEVEPVMLKLQEGGIEQSALHNHLLGETPYVMYMHIAGHGDPVQMAKVIHDAVALTKTPGPDASPRSPGSGRLGIRSETGRANSRAYGEGQRRSSSDRSTEVGNGHRFGHDSSSVDGSGDRSELPTDRQRQGRDHRGLRAPRK